MIIVIYICSNNMNKCNNNMGIADFLEKKQRGDVSRIADALRANGIEISNRMVDYMLKEY